MKKLIYMLKWILIILVLLLLGYFAYMHFNFYRIEDKQDLTSEIKNNKEQSVKVNKEYTLLTSNFGFGAHNKSFTFFMDSGKMKDGSEVRGTQSIASSKESVIENTKKQIDLLKKYDSDFIFLQEVDMDSTRAYHVNQVEMMREALAAYGSVFDCNLHVPYLLYPITEPHGYANSGLLSFSKYKMNSAIHRKLFINEGFIERFIDLDRCFTVIRVPVKDGKDLVLINLHLSAYDKGGSARKEQLKLLNTVMTEEYIKGNYVILGGDFNHILNKDYKALKTEQEKPKWVFLFPKEKLAEHFRIIDSENADKVGTCRTSDLPYQEGVNYRVRIDGFIVSDNIEASSEIIDAGFDYSDHNPVIMKFKLKE